MGYTTSYTLFAHRVADPEIAERIAESLRSCDVIGYALNEDYQFAEDGVEFFSYDSVNWYDHEEDMRAISKEFPNIHFELHGEGEMNADIWTQHFLGGKSQFCRAEIIIPPFDPEKLE